MNTEEQYVLINQNNQYYQEFDGFKGIPRHTKTIHHAWIYPTIPDAKQARKDITEWCKEYNNKINIYTYVIAKIIVSIEIIK